MRDELVLSPEEKKAIAALRRLEKAWPKSLWLYSASGSLCVMKKNADGEHAETSSGGVDQNYIAAKIKIENDGGDW